MTTDEAVKVFSEIEAGPPLMRTKRWRALIGKAVDWTATFFSGEPEREKRAFIALRHEASDKMLFASVKLADYPWLLSCQRGEELRVQGRISKIEPLTIHLETVHLTQAAAQVAQET
jgi:hypothetical protein